MKKALLYVPIVLSLLVAGAHFMRDGNELVVAAVLALLGVLFVRQPWAARLVQVALALAAVEWVLTIYGLVQVRIALEQPYTRMAIILGTVVGVTLVAALLFETKTLRRIYQLADREGQDSTDAS